MAWQMYIAPFGVIFLVMMTWWLGAFKRAPVLDAALANLRFHNDYPDYIPTRTIVTADGMNALLEFENDAPENNALGLVLAVGDKFVTRLCKKGDLQRVSEQGDTLILHTGDAVDPNIRLAIADRASLAAWRNTAIELMRA